MSSPVQNSSIRKMPNTRKKKSSNWKISSVREKNRGYQYAQNVVITIIKYNFINNLLLVI